MRTPSNQAFFAPSTTAHPCVAESHRYNHPDTHVGEPDHPLCCDCELCLNGPGGLVLPGCGVVVASSGKPGPIVRELFLAKERLRDQRRRAKRKAAA